MKRRRFLDQFIRTLLVVVLVAGCFTGCGKKKSTTADTKPISSVVDENVSREAFMGLIGEKFGMGECLSDAPIFSDVPATNLYYNAIQACAEWDVIEKGGSFRPTDSITLGEALECAVKAVGLDAIDLAVNATRPADDKLIDFFCQNIASIDVSDPDRTISKEVAANILDCAVIYRGKLTRENTYDFTLGSRTHEVLEGVLLKGDGETAIVKDASQYEVGDILYLPNLGEGNACAIRIREIDGDRVKYDEASIDETFESMRVSGTYDLKLINVEPADGSDVAFIDENGNYITACGFNDSKSAGLQNNLVYDGTNFMTSEVDLKQEKGGVTFSVEVACNGESTNFKDEEIEYSASAKFLAGVYNIKATVDYYHGWLGIPNGAYVTLSYDDEVSVHLAGCVNVRIPLGVFTMAIPGTPVTIDLSLSALLGADGTVDIVYTSDVVCTVDAQKGKPIKSSVTSTANMTAEAKARLVAEANLLADLKIIGINVANAEITTGVIADIRIEADILGDQPTCCDIFAYVPLKWGINQKGCLLTDISKSLKASGTVWDSKNSPFQAHYHYEDWKPVDKCTRGESKEVEVPTVQEDGKPLEEYKFFDFEELDVGFIRLGSQKMYLEKDETLKVCVKSVPTGYSESDLTYTPKTSGIVSISSNGQVTALTEGTTLVEVATKDGKYKTYLNVVVNATYTTWEDFESVSL